MSEDNLDEEFCYKENTFFPRHEFFDHPTWGRVHDKAPCHTILGTDINDEPFAFIDSIPPPQDPPAF